MSGLSLTGRIRRSDIRRELGAAPLCGKEPVEVVWASDQDASRESSVHIFQACPTGKRTQCRDFKSHLAWEQLRDTAPGGSGKRCWGDGCLDD